MRLPDNRRSIADKARRLRRLAKSLSGQAGHASINPGPTSSRISARTRASFGIVTIMPASRMTVEVAHQRVGMHVIDNAANQFAPT